jgi:predicted transcriptional regulator
VGWQVLKRGRLQIIADILLSVSMGPLIKTRLMYRSNLDSKGVEKYLEFLLREGFIARSPVEERMVYQITEKGRGFLTHYRAISESLGEIGPMESVPIGFDQT